MVQNDFNLKHILIILSRTILNLQYLPVLLEFIQHHLNIGVTHIFLTMPFPWHGAVMTQYARILKSYIDEGSVSLTSHLDNSNLQLYSVMGMTLQRDNMKTFQVPSD